ncbi:MAG: hypothetical protein V4726_17895 [Verrucomicrobiota bacterium]
MKKRSLTRTRRSLSRPVLCTAGILTGAFAFSGEAEAATLLSENFEGAANVFAMPTYAYSGNYTAANGLTPAGGLKYGHGGAGANGSVSTNTFSAAGNPVSLLADGITGAAVDAGGISYNFYAQFSSYLSQVDYAQVTATFLNGSSGVISSLDLGGQAFTAALTPAGNVNKDWLADSRAGLVPVGARSVTFTVTATKSAGGVNIDGYLDNVQFSVNPVPEPTAAVLALGALSLGWRRRRV